MCCQLAAFLATLCAAELEKKSRSFLYACVTAATARPATPLAVPPAGFQGIGLCVSSRFLLLSTTVRRHHQPHVLVTLSLSPSPSLLLVRASSFTSSRPVFSQEDLSLSLFFRPPARKNPYPLPSQARCVANSSRWHSHSTKPPSTTTSPIQRFLPAHSPSSDGISFALLP